MKHQQNIKLGSSVGQATPLLLPCGASSTQYCSVWDWGEDTKSDGDTGSYFSDASVWKHLQPTPHLRRCKMFTYIKPRLSAEEQIWVMITILCVSPRRSAFSNWIPKTGRWRRLPADFSQSSRPSTPSWTQPSNTHIPFPQIKSESHRWRTRVMLSNHRQ